MSQAVRMLSFCSTSGPLFMLGTIGAGMFYAPAAGAVIALSHYAAALLNGLAFRGEEELEGAFQSLLFVIGVLD